MKKISYALVLIIIFITTFSSACFYFTKQNNLKLLQSSNIDKVKSNDSDKSITNNKTAPKDSGSATTVKQNSTTSSNPSIALKMGSKKIVTDRPLYTKEVFLTFDDGPSVNTLKILKILDDYNVKATFFVVGNNVASHPQLIKDEYNDGMCILNHSYTHEYSMYKSIKTCLADFEKCNAAIKNVIGILPLPFIRFPGGSDNTVSNSKEMKAIRDTVVSSGIDYVDWNALSGDADSETVPVISLEHNSLKQLSSTNFAVTLMHDASVKVTTVEALPTIINYLKNQGFVFRTFNDLTSTEEKEMIKRRIINKGANN